MQYLQETLYPHGRGWMKDSKTFLEVGWISRIDSSNIDDYNYISLIVLKEANNDIFTKGGRG
jgi:hypothetical protein